MKLRFNIDASEHRKWDDMPPLWVAARNNEWGIARLFLKSQATVDNLGGQYFYPACTPLWVAAKKGHVEMVRLLLQNNAHIDAHNAHHVCPLEVSLEQGHLDVARELLECGAGLFNSIKSSKRLLYLLNIHCNFQNKRIEINDVEILLLNDNKWITRISELGALPLEQRLKLVYQISPGFRAELLPGVAEIVQSAALEKKALRYFCALEQVLDLHSKNTCVVPLRTSCNQQLLSGFNNYRQHVADIRTYIAAAITNTNVLPKRIPPTPITESDKENLSATLEVNNSQIATVGLSLSLSNSLNNDRPLKRRKSYQE